MMANKVDKGTNTFLKGASYIFKEILDMVQETRHINKSREEN